jgi:hypothetical protein
MRQELYYVGMDVHKRTISFCVKKAGLHLRSRIVV